MRAKSSENNRYFAFFLLFWAILFGSLVRIVPVLGSEMPVNDGGLFFSMAQDIKNQNYSLPFYASYNHAGIPFAYPPLAFYLAAMLSSFVPLLQIVRWLPPIVSIITLPIIFIFGREVLKSDLKAGLATVAYAFLPATYQLTITGGGLTRSLGLLFSMLTLLFAYRLFNRPRLFTTVLTALSASLLILSHPVAAIHTVISCLVFWAFWGRTKTGTLNALGVALLTVLFTYPWWSTVLSRHGVAPFLAAMNTGVNKLVFFLPLLRLNLGEELFLDLISLLAIFGLFSRIARRDYLLPIWTLAIFIVGRDAQTSAMTPFAFAASFGFLDIVSLGFSRIGGKFEKIDLSENSIDRNFSEWFSAGLGIKLLLGLFLIYPLFNAFSSSITSSIRVTNSEKKAIEWVNHHVPDQSRFLILTFGDPLNTPFQEWFPALTNQINLTVTQGYEWLPGQQFSQRLRAFDLLQPCLTQNLDCVETWVGEMGYEYDYIYVYRGYVGREEFEETEILFADLLIDDLSHSPNHLLVYETPYIYIYSHR